MRCGCKTIAQPNERFHESCASNIGNQSCHFVQLQCIALEELAILRKYFYQKIRNSPVASNILKIRMHGHPDLAHR